MAINPLPTNLYSGEAERINLAPHIQFQTQLLQHKAAKDEALDEYYKKLPETINDKGVRDQEVPLINGAKNSIQDFYMKNREAIKNPKIDNGAAQFELQKKYREAGNLVRQSQNRAKTDLLLGKMRFEGDKGYIFQDPDFVNKLHAHTLPVGEQGSQELDLANVVVPPKPFDPSAFSKKFADVKGEDDTPIIQPHPSDKYSNLVITPKKFGEAAKQTIYQRAATDYHNDPSFTKEIDTVSTKPEIVKPLSDLFQKNFGHPLQTKEDLAAAYALQNVTAGGTKQEVKDNGLKAKERQQAAFNHSDLAQARMFKHQEDAAKAKLGVGDSVNINDIYQNINDATDNPNTAILQEGKRVGTRVNALNADAQKVLVDYANKMRPNEKIGNDNIYIHKEADGTIKLYRTDDSDENNPGKVIKNTAHLIGELPKVTLNLPAQPGVKEKRAVIQQGNAPATKKAKDPLGLF